MADVEEVEDGAEEGDDDAEAHVDFHAGGAADAGEEEVDGVEEEAHDADDEEDVVPEGHAFGSRVLDLVPPGDLLPEREGGREVADAGGGGGVRVECVNHFGAFLSFWGLAIRERLI